MKSIGIVTDSYGEILPKEADRLGIMVLPMPFYFGEECFYEEVSISREDFFKRLNAGESVTTSQPSPGLVMQIWRESLQKFEKILYMPLSSDLSGACNNAKMLAEEDEFKGRVFVVDHGRISTPMHRSILDALELIEEGYSAEEIREILEASKDKMAIYIAVETLDFLKRGGRLDPATATVGTLLNVKPILRFNIGVLETYKKSRGMKKARKEMLKAVKQELETTFREYYDKREVYLLAASNADEATTQNWLEEIQAFFPDMEILCDKFSLGLSCHIGEGALGVGCSCRPKR